MEDVPSAARVFEEPKGLGVQLAIDDSGIGYSSLSYLKRFPVDYVKIDRSFVDGLKEEAKDTMIVAGIRSTARTLGLRSLPRG